MNMRAQKIPAEPLMSSAQRRGRGTRAGRGRPPRRQCVAGQASWPGPPRERVEAWPPADLALSRHATRSRHAAKSLGNVPSRRCRRLQGGARLGLGELAERGVERHSCVMAPAALLQYLRPPPRFERRAVVDVWQVVPLGAWRPGAERVVERAPQRRARRAGRHGAGTRSRLWQVPGAPAPQRLSARRPPLA
jgi:hypothetical protein